MGQRIDLFAPNVIRRVVAAIVALIGGIALPAGCGAVSPGAGGQLPPPALGPVTALRVAYQEFGQGRAVVFVDVDGLSAEELLEVIGELEDDLGLRVHPAVLADRSDPDLPVLTPVDPETGEIGVALVLRSITVLTSDRVRADVTYARSGLDGGDVSLEFDWQDRRWVLSEVRPTAVARLVG